MYSERAWYKSLSESSCSHPAWVTWRGGSSNRASLRVVRIKNGFKAFFTESRLGLSPKAYRCEKSSKEPNTPGAINCTKLKSSLKLFCIGVAVINSRWRFFN